MCLAIPAKIVEINGKDARAEISGVQRKIRLDLIEDCRVGDHVLIHAGFAITKLDEQALKETQKTLAEFAQTLSESPGPSD